MIPDNGVPAGRPGAGSVSRGSVISDRPWPLTARERLLLCCSVLRDHGITAGPAVGDRAAGPESARMQMVNEIWHRNPAASASYVFWYPDDDSCFAADGSLRRPLTLLHSGGAVGRALQTVLARVGLRGVDVDGVTLHLVPLPPTVPELN